MPIKTRAVVRVGTLGDGSEWVGLNEQPPAGTQLFSCSVLRPAWADFMGYIVKRRAAQDGVQRMVVIDAADDDSTALSFDIPPVCLTKVLQTAV